VATTILMTFFTVISLNAKSIFVTDNHFLSPNDYGANGSDRIDDTNAFQKCINEAKKNKTSKIVVSPGTYIIGQTILIESISNLTIEGAGAILVKPFGNKSNILFGNFNSQITIRDMVFEGNRDQVYQGQWPEKMNACAIIGRSSGIRFENCVVRNFYYGVCFGTSTENGYDVWVIDCQFENNNSDIDLYGKPSLHIRGNVSHNCTGNSIQIEPPYKRKGEHFDYLDQPEIDALSVGNIVSENVIVGCNGIGINIFGGCENITVSNNQIINYGISGIMTHAGSKNLQISGNIISNSQYPRTNERPWKDQGAGIVLSRVENVVIGGNIISHPNTGIFVSGTNGAIICNNKVSDSKDAGICLYNAEKCQISQNTIENSNLSQSWWGNSGIVVYSSKDISICSTTILDRNKSSYSIFTGDSSNVTINNVLGYGYKTSLTYPANL